RRRDQPRQRGGRYGNRDQRAAARSRSRPPGRPRGAARDDAGEHPAADGADRLASGAPAVARQPAAMRPRLAVLALAASLALARVASAEPQWLTLPPT